MENLLRLTNVSKVYRHKQKEIRAVTNINFQIYPNEVVSLLGASGCGKTTLLKLLADLLPPSSGSIDYQKKDISFARKSGLLGWMPQRTSLLPHRNVVENISLALELKNNNPVDKTKLFELIKIVGLAGYEKFYPHQLSGGMQQRVALARAIVYHPDLLLMDEPFSSIDEITREKLQIDLLAVKKQIGQTIIFVTHNIEEAVFLSNRVILMSASGGEIIGEIKIDLPELRGNETRQNLKFFTEVKKVREALRNKI